MLCDFLFRSNTKPEASDSQKYDASGGRSLSRTSQSIFDTSHRRVSERRAGIGGLVLAAGAGVERRTPTIEPIFVHGGTTVQPCAAFVPRVHRSRAPRGVLPA
jgi:hypothetical protein